MNIEMRAQLKTRLLQLADEYIAESEEHEDEEHAAKLSLEGRINDFLIFWSAARGLDDPAE